MQADLVIVGAGLAGSCLAAAVAQRGWQVVVLERQRGPRHKVCGEFLSPESQSCLHALGLYSTVAALGPAQIEHAQIISRHGVQLDTQLPGVAWGVSRFKLDAALAQAAANYGAIVHAGLTGTAIQQIQGGYQVEARDMRGDRVSIGARAAVMACGRYMGAGFKVQQPVRPAQQLYVGIKCHYTGLALPPVVRLYFFDGGYVGLSPIEDGRANLCMLVTEQAFARGGKRIASMLDAVAHWNPALARDLAGGHREKESMVAVAAVDTERPTVLWDGCAHVGDAATMIPPLCGDGQAMAIHAAEMCAPLIDDLLSGRRSLDSWAAAYRATWHAEYDRPLWMARWLQAILGQPILNDALISIGALLPSLAQQFIRATRGRQRTLQSNISATLARPHGHRIQ